MVITPCYLSKLFHQPRLADLSRAFQDKRFSLLIIFPVDQILNRIAFHGGHHPFRGMIRTQHIFPGISMQLSHIFPAQFVMNSHIFQAKLYLAVVVKKSRHENIYV